MTRFAEGEADDEEFDADDDSTGTAIIDVPDGTSANTVSLSYDEERLADLRYVLQPTRLRLLQQILATDWGSLIPAELVFRNPDVSESTIRDHLREMTQRDRAVTAKLTVPEGKGERGIPRTFYAVTEYGIELLQSLEAYDGISLLYELYESVERPDEIREIEAFEHRPEPDWL
jgi:hypothetical protein